MSFVTQLFHRFLGPGRRSGRVNRFRRKVPGGEVASPGESLERRLAMAVDLGFQIPDGDGEEWVTVMVSDGSDAYLQMVATPTQDLLVADNSSFARPTLYAIENVNDNVDNVYVYNGQKVSRQSFEDGTVGNDLFGLPAGYPDSTSTAGKIKSLRFPLTADIDLSSAVNGTFFLGEVANSYPEKGLLKVLGTPNNGLLVTDSAGLPEASYAADIIRPGLGFQPYLELSKEDGSDLNVGNLAGLGRHDVPRLKIDFDANLAPANAAGQNVAQFETIVGGTVETVSPRLEGIQAFDIYDEGLLQYVPGTLTGEIRLDFGENGLAENRDLTELESVPLVFQVDEAGVGLDIPLSFGNGQHNAYGGTRVNEARVPFNTRDAAGEQQTQDLLITGSFNSLTGTITLTTRVDGGRPQSFPVWLERVEIGLRRLATIEATQEVPGEGVPGGGPDWPEVSLDVELANMLTLFDGHDLTRGLIAELPNRGSVVSLESPLVTTEPENGVVSLAATDIKISAPLRAENALIVRSGEDTLFDVYTETLAVESVVGSSAIEIGLDVRDDGLEPDLRYGNPETRTQLLVTQTGSLSNYNDVLTPVADITPFPAAQIYAEVNGGDMFIEGTVAAANHSYTIRSGINSEFEGPYQLTTKSRLTGVHTGTITGGTFAATLANDTLDDDFATLGVLESVFDVRTSVERLRVQASAAQPDFPFPYAIAVDEEDDLIVDAVVASGGDVSLEAAGSVDLLGSIASLSDVSISAGQTLTVSAPVSTAFGAIRLTAPSVDVRNAVRVLDAAVVDERRVDIAIEATAGDLLLNDAVSAVNGVSLFAEGVADPNDPASRANVTGSTRVTADILTVRAAGDVDIGTDVNVIDVIASGSVRLEESDSVAVTVRNAEEVNLTAQGRDKVSGAQISPALYADLFGVDKAFATAPNGSVDIRHVASGPLQVGDGDAIRQGAEGMVAAGSVTIKSSLASEVRLYDAPLATSGATEVRFATTNPLPAEDDDNRFTPAPIAGVFRTDLTTKLAIDVNEKTIEALNYVDARDIRVGDRILVKDGLTEYRDDISSRSDKDIVNGIYVVRNVSFETERDPQGLISNQWVRLGLARATAYDTTTELGGQLRHYVRVTDGNDGLRPEPSLAGTVFVSDGFGNIPYGENSNALHTPLKVDAVLPRAGFREAAAVNTLPLDAEFDALAGTVTSRLSESIRNDRVRAAFGDVSLIVGDLVVLSAPETGGTANPNNGMYNGLYEVISAGSNSSKWELRRHVGVDEDADGNPDGTQVGLVSITNGLKRTAVTGLMYSISYDSVNRAPLQFRPIQPVQPGGTSGSADGFWTEIGTGRNGGGVVYEVSGEGGRNDSAGSLGKMLELVHQNAAGSYSTVINDAVQRIDLEQELPLIEKPIHLESVSGLVIIGDDIVVDRKGGVVRSARIGTYVGPIRPSNAGVARRLVRAAGQDEPDVVHGFEVAVGGSGSVFRGMTLGGFERGGAVRLVGAGNVLLENLSLGGDAAGNRYPNAHGVLVENGNGGIGGEYSTLLNSRVVNSSEVEVTGGLLGAGQAGLFGYVTGGEGVKLAGNTDGFRIVGSTIGDESNLNIRGVEVDPGDAGRHLIGVRRVRAAEALARLTVTPTASNKLTVAKSDYTLGLEPGVQLFDRTTYSVWTIKSRSVLPYNRNMYELELEGSSPLASKMVGVPFGVESGYFVEFTARSPEVVLPKGFDRDRLYLGQPVDATIEGVLATDTTISYIEAVRDGAGIDTGETRVFLSQGAGLSRLAGVLFPNGAERNVIGYNVEGVVLKSGSSKMNATDITNSVGSGILVEGVAVGGTHVVGGVAGYPRSENGIGISTENVSISGNAADRITAGIELAAELFSDIPLLPGNLPDLPKMRERANQIIIQGNVFGADITTQEPRFANGIVPFRNIYVSGSPQLHAEFVEDDTRDPITGRYTAKYRPEDNRLQDPRLRAFESFGLEDNYHFVGESLPAEDDGDEWWNNLPVLG